MEEPGRLYLSYHNEVSTVTDSVAIYRHRWAFSLLSAKALAVEAFVFSD